jgi:hypothetical protein
VWISIICARFSFGSGGEMLCDGSLAPGLSIVDHTPLSSTVNNDRPRGNSMRGTARQLGTTWDTKQYREAFLACRLDTGGAGGGGTRAINGLIELHRRVAAASGIAPTTGYACSSSAAADTPRPSSRTRHS